MLKYVSQVLNYNEKKDLLLSCQLCTYILLLYIHSFSVKIVSKGKVLRSDFYDLARPISKLLLYYYLFENC